MKNFQWLLTISIAVTLFLAACSKDADIDSSNDGLPDCNSYRLQKRIFYGSGSTWTFYYDAQGRVSKKTETNAGSNDRISYYEYSLDNKPDKVRIVDLVNGAEVPVQEQTITYSSARHPVSLVKFYPNDNSTITHRYVTDNQGRIIIDSLSNSFYLVTVHRLEWSAEGNMLTDSSSYPIKQTAAVEFDDSPNPYYDIRYCFLDEAYGGSGSHYWSKNNVKSFKLKIGPIEEDGQLNPEYYSNKLIAKNSSGEYKYECK